MYKFVFCFFIIPMSAFADDSISIKGKLSTEYVLNKKSSDTSGTVGLSLGNKNNELGVSLDIKNNSISEIQGKLGVDSNNVEFKFGTANEIKKSENESKGLSLKYNFNYNSDGYFSFDKVEIKKDCIEVESTCTSYNYIIGGSFYQPITSDLDLSLSSRYKFYENTESIYDKAYEFGGGLRKDDDMVGLGYFYDRDGSEVQNGLKMRYSNEQSGFALGLSIYNNKGTDNKNKNSSNTFGIESVNRINQSTTLETGVSRTGITDENIDEGFISDYELRMGLSFSF